MRKLIVNKKTGFKIRDVNVPVIIRDARGMLFYSTEEIVPRAIQFNLPKGIYFVDSGNFTPLNSPVKYKLFRLKFPERFFYPSPAKFEVQFMTNPSKCSIDWDKKKIYFDNSFKEDALPIVDFILSHEFGHKYFGPENEDSVDDFAYNRMIKLGYNPLQIGYAQLESLSDSQLKRKSLLINKITNAYASTRKKL